MTTPTRRIDAGGLAGVIALALAIVGEVPQPIWSFPSTNAKGSSIQAFVSEHRSALQYEMVLNASAVALWIVFGCGVWLRIRAATDEPSILPACLVAGVTSFTSLLLAGFVAFDVLVYRTPAASEARLLYDLTFGLLAMSGLPTAIALVSYTLAVYKRGTMPRRTAHLAAIAGAAHVLLLLSFIVPAGFFSLQGYVIAAIPALLIAWIGDTAIVMLRFPPRAELRDPSRRRALVP